MRARSRQAKKHFKGASMKQIKHEFSWLQLGLRRKQELPSTCFFINIISAMGSSLQWQKKHCHSFFLKQFIQKKCYTKAQSPIFLFQTRQGLTLYELVKNKNFKNV